jgi:hypothetical protein
MCERPPGSTHVAGKKEEEEEEEMSFREKGETSPE